MYRKFFGIRKAPFSISPDPRFLYMSRQHREALAHLLYGIKTESGFVLLTGEVGTGKTTICRKLFQKLSAKWALAFIINPRLSAPELLAAICDEFRISYPEKTESTKVFVDLLNEHLLQVHAARRKAFLIIDEAQNLSLDVLEQIRLLTNLETDRCKLLRIILIGQPELRERLAAPELSQLSQRILARFHLGPLDRSDIGPYVNHRLRVAGVRSELFSPRCLSGLHAYSGGVPRLINAICDRALLGAYVRGKKQVDSAVLYGAACEVLGKQPPGAWRRKKATWIAAAGFVLVFLAAAVVYYFGNFSFPEFLGPWMQSRSSHVVHP